MQYVIKLFIVYWTVKSFLSRPLQLALAFNIVPYGDHSQL